ncbi:MAG: hypothetical protein OEL54_05775 [Flavobacteriaceae bacterium]|nr:hypothetical protein [Flavobacteriaceae bacterium]
MRIEEREIFTFEELSIEAQEKAIEDTRDGSSYLDYDWFDSTKEDFEDFLETIGFNGVNSYFSGFWSQGDGACFDFTSIELDKFFTDSTCFEPYTTLHNDFKKSNEKIIKKLLRFKDAVTFRSCENGYSTHHCHSKTRYIDFDIDGCGGKSHLINVEKATAAFLDGLRGLYESLSDEYYSCLNNQYDYLNSEEAIKDFIIGGDFEFLKNGEKI